MPGANNPADVLSKLWGYGSVRICLKAMLFWQGDTGAIAKVNVHCGNTGSNKWSKYGFWTIGKIGEN